MNLDILIVIIGLPLAYAWMWAVDGFLDAWKGPRLYKWSQLSGSRIVRLKK